MRSDFYIKKLEKFANNLEKISISILIEKNSQEIAQAELEQNWDKSKNIEGVSFDGVEWFTNDYKKKNSPYTSKRGKTFKHWYPRYKGTYKTLDLTGDFRENIGLRANLMGVEAFSDVSYADKIKKNLGSKGIDVFTFKNSKELKKHFKKELIKKFIKS